MITKGKLIENLFSLDSKDVTVTGVSSKGTTSFRIKYEIDLVKSIRGNVSSVTIQVRKKSDNVKGGIFSNSKGKSPVDVLESIRFRASRRKEKNERERSDISQEFSSDFTRKIDNGIARKIAEASNDEVEKLIGSSLIVKSVLAGGTGDLPEDIPIIQVPISEASKSYSSKQTSKQHSRHLILRKGLSPTQAGRHQPTFLTSEQTLQGVGVVSGLPETDSRDMKLLKRSFLGDVLSIESASNLSSSDKVPTQSRRSGRRAIIVETFQLESDQLEGTQNKFEIVARALTPAGSIVSSVAITVDNSEKIQDWMTKRSGVENINGTGVDISSVMSAVEEDALSGVEATVWEARRDLYGTKKSRERTGQESSGITDSAGLDTAGTDDVFDVYTKTNSGPFNPSDTSAWTKIGQIATGGLSEVLSQNYNKASRLGYAATTMLRYIGSSGKAEDFVELVIPGANNHLASTSFLMGSEAVAEVDVRFSSVTAFLRTGRIDVRVSEIETPGPVMVVRRDLSIHEKIYSPLAILEPIQVPNLGGAPLIFEDTSVKEDHIYEYRAKVFTREGRELLTSGRAILKYQILNGNSVEVNVSDPVVDIDSQGSLDVTFSITSQVPQTGLSALNSVLESAGLVKYFDADIQLDRENLSDLFAYQVERVDLKTGQRESFGIVTSSDFSDKSLQKTCNVSSLKAGRKYRYVITALLRTPDTLINSATRTKIDSITGKEYTFKPSRYLRPSVLKKGCLAAQDVVVGSNVSDEFLEGWAGVQRFVDVSTDAGKPSVVSSKVSRNASGQVVIRWNVKGSLSSIDHFVVSATKLNMKTIVGRVHNVSTTGAFKFTDLKLSKMVGEVTYWVTPIYNDYTQGTPVKAGKIEVISEAPVKKR